MKCSKLRGVAFSFDNPVHDPATGAALVNLVRRNPLLEYLQWPGNGWLSDDVLATIAACCPLLRELYAECKTPSALTDASVVALAQGCHQLTKVEGLSGPALTDASVMALAERCPNLETVHLQHSPLVTEAALTTLAQRCSKLDYLKVCSGSMDKAAIDRLQGAREGPGRLEVSYRALHTDSSEWDNGVVGEDV
jgi:hypothetical protein